MLEQLRGTYLMTRFMSTNDGVNQRLAFASDSGRAARGRRLERIEVRAVLAPWNNQLLFLLAVCCEIYSTGRVHCDTHLSAGEK
jgi:hypothetical protein